MKTLEDFKEVLRLPEGERIVAMCICQNVPVVATTNRLFQLVEGKMRPIVFVYPFQIIEVENK